MSLLFSLLFLMTTVHQAWTAAPPEDKVVLLGDSLTAWGDWPHYFPDARIRNFGIPGDTSDRILRRLEGVVKTRPHKIFLMAGINDLWSGRSPAHVAGQMEKIVTRLKEACPKATIFLQSTLPVNNRLLGPGIDNRDVLDLNRRLKILAETAGITFIDLTGRFRDERGQLRQEFTRDGVHLTPAGYQAWRSVIGPAMGKD